jgi:hypothetical protein
MKGKTYKAALFRGKGSVDVADLFFDYSQFKQLC